MQNRKIIHIDMDAFYASIEQRDNSSLKGKPVVVGKDTNRGVVAAASYEARKYSIHSAMSIKTAKLLCKRLNIVSPRFDAYSKVSKKIREIFQQYTDIIEPLSLDEAYLDVTRNKLNLPSATIIGQKIKQQILERTQLTASAGISINKFLAKTASDVNKPNGLFVIKPEESEAFIEKLPIRKFFGIGKVTAVKMHEMGIHTGKDLKKWNKKLLTETFGKQGEYFYNIARAIDNRSVNPNRERKSVGVENTFLEDIYLSSEINTKIDKLTKELIRRLNKALFKGKTLTLKIKYQDFEQITRSKTFPHVVKNEQEIYFEAIRLLEKVEIQHGIRLLGLTVSNSTTDEDETTISNNYQLTLDF